jgi:WD40 repeat protein
VYGLSVSSDGARLATSDAEGVVRLYDVATARELERFVGHVGAAHCVALAGEGKSLISGGIDNSARLWSVSAQQVFIANATNLVDASFAPAAAQFITASATETTVNVWDGAGKQVRACAAAPTALKRLAVRGDEMQIAGSDAQGRLLLWNVADGALAATVETGGAINDVAYSNDGKRIVVAGAAQVRVYDSVDGKLLQEQTCASPTLTARFAPDGREIVTGSEKAASVWAYASPTATSTLTGHQGPVYSIALSADGTRRRPIDSAVECRHR